MNILYVTHRLPYPPNKGEKIRVFHQIAYLSKYHSIRLLSLTDEKSPLAHVESLRRHCVSVETIYRSKIGTILGMARAFGSGSPMSVGAFVGNTLLQRFRNVAAIGDVDVIVLSSSSLAQCLMGQRIRTVVDFMDVDSKKWSEIAAHRRPPWSWLYDLESRRLARHEEQAARAASRVVLVSEAEQKLFESRSNTRNSVVVTNGVDLAYFTAPEYQQVPDRELSIVFTGVMDYFPNADAVQYMCCEILPLVLEEVRECRFWIVGRNPTRAVRNLRRYPNVTVTGAVPDVRPYLARARLAVAPFRIARGVQNKVLEAMAMGLPVVGTGCAFAGIKARAREGACVADDPKLFAAAVVKVLTSSDEEYAGLRNSARRYVEAHHRWEDQGAKLEALLIDVIND